MARYRLDNMILHKGLAPSREKARALILAGRVLVNGRQVDKAGTMVAEGAELFIQPEACRYVSRGGLKMEKAIQHFDLQVDNSVVLDIGASTGGFTDCVLQHGAARVYAVDVGYGQLDWTLRQDPRVINMEKKNIRYMTGRDLVERVDLVLVDVSFISVRKIMTAIKELIREQADIIILVKPQFEAGREKVGKKGVVKDAAVHREVLAQVIQSGIEYGLHFRNLTYSPVKGPRGNIEYLVHLKEGEPGPGNLQESIDKTVAEAHETLGVR